MTCSLLGAKLLSEPLLGYSELYHKEQNSEKYLSKFKHFHSRKCVWKCRLENCGHFVSASIFNHSEVLSIRTDRSIQPPHEHCALYQSALKRPYSRRRSLWNGERVMVTAPVVNGALSSDDQGSHPDDLPASVREHGSYYFPEVNWKTF